jgi:hypothetical protein
VEETSKESKLFDSFRSKASLHFSHTLFVELHVMPFTRRPAKIGTMSSKGGKPVALPAGWTEEKSNKGRTHYFNSPLKFVQYHRPTPEDLADPEAAKERAKQYILNHAQKTLERQQRDLNLKMNESTSSNNSPSSGNDASKTGTNQDKAADSVGATTGGPAPVIAREQATKSPAIVGMSYEVTTVSTQNSGKTSQNEEGIPQNSNDSGAALQPPLPKNKLPAAPTPFSPKPPGITGMQTDSLQAPPPFITKPPGSGSSEVKVDLQHLIDALAKQPHNINFWELRGDGSIKGVGDDRKEVTTGTLTTLAKANSTVRDDNGKEYFLLRHKDKKKKKVYAKRQVGSTAGSVKQMKDATTRIQAAGLVVKAKALQAMTTYSLEAQTENNPSSDTIIINWDEIVPRPDKEKEGARTRKEPAVSLLVPSKMSSKYVIYQLEEVVKILKSGSKRKARLTLTDDPKTFLDAMYGEGEGQLLLNRYSKMRKKNESEEAEPITQVDV